MCAPSRVSVKPISTQFLTRLLEACQLVHAPAVSVDRQMERSAWSADDVSVPTEAASAPDLPGRPPLDAGALEAFGGVGEVVQQLRAAPSGEARSNLFCVLFDHALAQLRQVRRPAAVDGMVWHAAELHKTGANTVCAAVKLDTAYSGVACDDSARGAAQAWAYLLQDCVQGWPLLADHGRLGWRCVSDEPLRAAQTPRWILPTCARWGGCLRSCRSRMCCSR
jgi:hypothetical protein